MVAVLRITLCKEYCMKQSQQDHCRGIYLPPRITGEEIPFLRYAHFFIFRKINFNELKIILKIPKKTLACESSPKCR